MLVGHRTYGHSQIERRGVHNNITIGRYCSIAKGVVMDGGFGHNPDFISTYPFHTFDGVGNNHLVCKGDIIIGNDVWIGEHSLIMSGVTIGDGAVIGARAIITKDVEPYSVVVGTNRVIRKRFTDEQIKNLLEIEWWNWEDHKVLANAHLLTSNNINEFISKHG